MTTFDPTPDAAPTASELLAKELETWWHEVSQADLMLIAPKAVEYGSTDLEMLGTAMAGMVGLKDPSRGEATELACLFYLYGKVARAVGAWRDGRQPSDDTYLDISQYTMMIRRVREAGGWPSA